jgi:hypothetical protein
MADPQVNDRLERNAQLAVKDGVLAGENLGLKSHRVPDVAWLS